MSLLVFPVGAEGDFNNDTVNGDVGWSYSEGVPTHPSIPVSDSNGAWAHTNFPGVNTEGDPGWHNEEGLVNATGNGLYWFWDSTWG